MPTSVEIEGTIRVAQVELKQLEDELLRKKEDLIKKIESILPNRIDSTISSIISTYAAHVERMSFEDLKSLKKDFATEKPRAVQNGIAALRSSSEWLSCQPRSRFTGSDPIGSSGIDISGPIWKSFLEYTRSLENICVRYGFKLDEMYSWSPFKAAINPYTEELEEQNKAMVEAHRKYCDAKNKVESLQNQLKVAKAKEKFEAA